MLWFLIMVKSGSSSSFFPLSIFCQNYGLWTLLNCWNPDYHYAIKYWADVVLQIGLKFRSALLFFAEITGFGLCKLLKIIVIRPFCLYGFIFCAEFFMWIYHDKLQIKFLFRSATKNFMFFSKSAVHPQPACW